MQGPTRRLSARQSPRSHLPDDARDFLDRAEKIVYLFPRGFDPEELVSDEVEGEGAFEYDSLVGEDGPTDVLTFVGRFGAHRFAIEVRPRSATIISDLFDVRRDLLLVLKEYAERRRRETA